ncbi:efflux transporter outer membrane subunit [Frateuria aurantia]
MRRSSCALGASLAFLSILAGCSTSHGLHPQLKPTDAAALALAQTTAQAGFSQAAWPAEDWWRALGDPQLDALEREALAGNPDIALADARLRAAEAQARTSKAARAPTLDMAAGIGGGRVPPAVVPGEGSFKSAKYGALNFQWDLDLWGGKREAWAAAVGDARAAEVDAQAARVELSGSIARAYVQLAYAYTQQDVAEAEHQRSVDARQLTRQRVAAGIDNQSQLKQSDAEVASADQQVLAAREAIDDARIQIAILLGKGPDRGLSLTRPAALPLAIPGLPQIVPAELIGHRADLVAARWRVEAAEHSIRSSKAQFLPNISISALAGALAVGSANPFEFPAAFYGGGPALSLPIFDGGRRRANLAGADASYDQAVAQYDKVLIAAVNDIAQQLTDVQSLQAQLQAQQRARDAALAAWSLAAQRYHAGIGSYLEALVVRQQLLSADQKLADLHARQLDLSVQLVQSLGGGFHTTDRALTESSSQHPL